MHPPLQADFDAFKSACADFRSRLHHLNLEPSLIKELGCLDRLLLRPVPAFPRPAKLGLFAVALPVSARRFLCCPACLLQLRHFLSTLCAVCVLFVCCTKINIMQHIENYKWFLVLHINFVDVYFQVFVRVTILHIRNQIIFRRLKLNIRIHCFLQPFKFSNRKNNRSVFIVKGIKHTGILIRTSIIEKNSQQKYWTLSLLSCVCVVLCCTKLKIILFLI